MNTKIFLNGGNGLPTLYLDMVLFESVYPVLFTCVDEQGNLYICSCHRADGSRREWIIVQTSPEKVIQLLSNKMTIRQIFDNGEGAVYRAVFSAQSGRTALHKTSIVALPEEILPTPGFYMDAESDEFEEEIAILEQRQSSQESITHSAFSLSYSFYVSTQPCPLPSPVVGNFLSKKTTIQSGLLTVRV